MCSKWISRASEGAINIEELPPPLSPHVGGGLLGLSGGTIIIIVAGIVGLLALTTIIVVMFGSRTRKKAYEDIARRLSTELSDTPEESSDPTTLETPSAANEPTDDQTDLS